MELTVALNTQTAATVPDALLSASDGLPPDRRFLAKLTIAISMMLALLDGSIANVALPLIAVDLHATAASAIWVVNGYQLAMAVCLIPFAALGAIYSYRSVYRLGLTIFTIASVVCALSHWMPMLTLARIAQGVGAAGIMSVNSALIRYIVPRRELGRAIGFNAFLAATSATLGPTIAGFLLSFTTWPWLFAINLPLGAVAMTLAAKNLPDNDRTTRAFDYISAILSGLMIGMFVMSIESFGHGVGLIYVFAMLAISVISAVLLVRRELRIPLPLFPFDLLRVPVFGLSMGTSIASYAAQMMTFVSLPFLFHDVYGFSPSMVGLLMTPWPLMVALSSPLAGRLSDRMSPGWLGGIGLGALSLGLLAMGLLPSAPHPWDIVWRMMLCGIGFGLFQAPNNRMMLSAAPKARTGAASGMLGTSRLTGQACGTAMVALILSHLQVSGARVAILCGAGLALVACAVSLLRLRVTARETIERDPDILTIESPAAGIMSPETTAVNAPDIVRKA